jgi:Amt family ammonium transporter
MSRTRAFCTATNTEDTNLAHFLLTCAAAIPAIISGGIAERARFWPQLIATAVVVGFV